MFPRSRSAPAARLPTLLSGLALTGAATLIGFGLTEPTPEARSGLSLPTGKNADRLALAAEDAPAREPRILGTIAMFALPQADSRGWSERPVASPKAVEPLRAEKPSASLPRIAAAEASADKPLPMLPPARPTPLPTAEPKPAAVEVPASVVREPVRVFGWAVPGTKHLPTRGDALKAAEGVRDGAAAVGSGAGRLVLGVAEKVGGAIADAGQAAGELLGLD